MSGAISLSTIALLAGAGAAVGGTAYSIYNGQQQAGEQKKALASQNKAQQQAQSNALSTERQSAVAENAANQQKPDLAAILSRAAKMGNNGLSSTMLTGPTGVNTSNLNLGKQTLLGS